MAFVALAACLLLGQAPKAAPDRSGESDLRGILAWAQKLDHAHVVIYQEARNSATSPFYPGLRLDVWLAGPKFRFETSGYWGEESYVASDGATVISDAQDESTPVVLIEAKGSLVAAFEELKSPMDDLSPLFALMKGPGQIDKLVEKDAPIRREPDLGSEKVISFAHKKLGTERLFYRITKEGPLLDRIEYDNLPSITEMLKGDPEIPVPEPGMLTRNDIWILPLNAGKELFEVRVPKGRSVDDRRKKHG